MATEYVVQRDLDALRIEMRGEFAQVRGEFAQVRGEFALVRGEMAAMEGRLRQEIGTTHSQIGDLKVTMGAQTRTLVYANVGAAVGIGGLVLAAAALA